MTIDTPKISHAPVLRRLMMDTFGESDAFLDLFYSVAYSPERARAAYIDDKLVSALYWFDCECGGDRIAYLYAIATDKAHRGCGAASALIRNTEEHLRALGYSSAILVPQSPSLFSFYENLGFNRATEICEFSVEASKRKVALRELSADEFVTERARFLEDGGIKEDVTLIKLLTDNAKFYTGEDFLLAASRTGDHLVGIELLGARDLAPDILASLGCRTGRFRTPGQGRDFAMYLPLSPTATRPTYFGIALDI